MKKRESGGCAVKDKERKWQEIWEAGKGKMREWKKGKNGRMEEGNIEDGKWEKIEKDRRKRSGKRG